MSEGGWKYTPVGRVARYVGSVRFAVPLMAIVAVAMMWGTWVDSTAGRVRAAELVYGSWWFIGLMVLVCASLIVSVVMRYPWRRKHIGFIVVHASLIGLITVGFYTMFTKVEGRMILHEGMSTAEMQMDAEQVELLEHGSTGLEVKGAATLGNRRTLAFEGLELDVLGQWPNTGREVVVTNDRTDLLHAAEVSVELGATAGVWIEEEAREQVGTVVVQVMAQDETWAPPSGEARVLLVGGETGRMPLPEPGTALGDTGWTITSADVYRSATIGAGGAISERADGAPNPAVRVVLRHADGSVERHTAYEKSPTAQFKQQVSGATTSPFSLLYEGQSLFAPTLAIMRDTGGRVHALYAEAGAEPVAFEHDGQWPWVIMAGREHVTVLRDYDRAAGTEKVVEAPAGENNRPALLVAADADAPPTPLLWNQPTPVKVAGQDVVLRYGPVTHELPFELQLMDFRRSDYPGSNAAMAYESDVRVALPDAEPFDFNIHMNHPYEHAGWRVYQSGYQGEDISIFQLTRDPGLGYMYFFCTTLCVGIVLTFYSRSLSWGHPDIPAPFQGQSH